MSLSQSVSVAEGQSGHGIVTSVELRAVEKLDLTLEEIISTGAEGQREGSSTGALSRRYRKVGPGQFDGRSQNGRRIARPETLVNLKVAGSISKRKNTPLGMSGGVQFQYGTGMLRNRSMLAAKAFQQLPAMGAQNKGAFTGVGGYTQRPQLCAAYQSWSSGHVPHVFVPTVTPQGSLRSGGSRFGQGGRLGAQEAALLSTEITQQENGDIIIRFKQTDLVRIKSGTGDLILDSGGYRTFSTKAILNQALQPVGLWVDESFPPSDQQNESSAGDSNQVTAPAEWVVSDRRSYLAAFVDGMVIKQAGALSKAQMIARGSVIAQYLRQKKFDAEKLSRNLNNKGGQKRRLRKSELAEEGSPVFIRAENVQDKCQHQALESVNEQADAMVE